MRSMHNWNTSIHICVLNWARRTKQYTTVLRSAAYLVRIYTAVVSLELLPWGRETFEEWSKQNERHVDGWSISGRTKTLLKNGCLDYDDKKVSFNWRDVALQEFLAAVFLRTERVCLLDPLRVCKESRVSSHLFVQTQHTFAERSYLSCSQIWWQLLKNLDWWKALKQPCERQVLRSCKDKR